MRSIFNIHSEGLQFIRPRLPSVHSQPPNFHPQHVFHPWYSVHCLSNLSPLNRCKITQVLDGPEYEIPWPNLTISIFSLLVSTSIWVLKVISKPASMYQFSIQLCGSHGLSPSTMTLVSMHKMFSPTIFVNMRLALQLLHFNQLLALNLPHPTHSWPTLLITPLLSL